MTVHAGTIWGDFGTEKLNSATKPSNCVLGTRLILPDGRVFRLAFAGATIGAGMVLMQKMGAADHDMDKVPNAAAIGVKTITLQATGTALTANQYAEGYLYVNDGSGEGHVYRIASHPAATSAATCVLTLADGDTVKEALATADSLVGLMANPYKDVELWDCSDVDGVPIGVAPTEVTDDYYFWAQTWGMAAVLIEGSKNVPVLGCAVIATQVATTGIDGSCEAPSTALIASGAVPSVIGVMSLIAAVDTDYGMVDLKISP